MRSKCSSEQQCARADTETSQRGGEGVVATVPIFRVDRRWELENQLQRVRERQRDRDDQQPPVGLQKMERVSSGPKLTPSAPAEARAPASSSGRNGRSPQAAARPSPSPM